MTDSASVSSPARRPWGLQTLLVAVPVLVVLPLVVYAAVLLYLMADSSKRDVRQDVVQGSRTLALAVERELASATRVLQLAADSPSLQADAVDHERFGLLVRRMLEADWGLTAVALLDRQGRQALDAAGPIAQQPPRALRPHHERVFRTGLPVVSDLHACVVDGKLSISISVPVTRGGQVAWVLTARLDTDRLNGLLIEPAAQSDSVAMILDSQHQLFARSRDIEPLFGLPPSEQAAAALRTGRSGVAAFAEHDDAMRLWAWTTLPSGWVVFLGKSAASYEAPLRASMLRLAAAGLVALALGVLVAVLVARRIGASVDAMARNAPRLMDGQTPPYAPSRIRQLDVLYHTLEAAAQRLAGAVRERAEALAAERAARAEAERANRAKDEFVAMLSHELRNPLSPIVNALKLLGRAEALTERGRAAVAMAERQTGQLKRLVDDLMESTRLTRGKLALKPQSIDVAGTVRDAVAAVAAAAAERDQAVGVSVSPAAGRILADPVRVAQVLENLLGNAVKYTQPGGRIEVEATGDAEQVCIRVRDNGMGIDAADLPGVFDLFTQAAVTLDRAQGGLGIGLAWVKSIVELHGGSVSAASPGRGRGATFTVRLPRRCTLAQACDPVQAQAAAEAAVS